MGVEGGVELGDPNWDTMEGMEPAERADTLAIVPDISTQRLLKYSK